jgi:hypothetical protein
MFAQLKAPFQNRRAGARIDVSDGDGQLLVKAGIAEAVAHVPGILDGCWMRLGQLHDSITRDQ